MDRAMINYIACWLCLLGGIAACVAFLATSELCYPQSIDSREFGGLLVSAGLVGFGLCGVAMRE